MKAKPTKPLTLRQFLYRDDILVRDFLAQLEGGISRSARKTSRSAKGLSASGHLDPSFARADINRGSESFDEDEHVLDQTASSQFERLHHQLETSHGMRSLGSLQPKAWDAVGRGEIVEIEVELQIAGFRKLSNLGAEFEKLVALMEALGSAAHPNASQALTGMKALGSLDNASVVPVVATAIGSAGHRFACLLQSRSLRVDADALEGEATMFGKVQRKLKPGEEYVALPGMGPVLRASGTGANNFLKIFDGENASTFGLIDPRIVHPGAVVAPIAIFR